MAGRRRVSTVEIGHLARLYRMPVAHFVVRDSALTDVLTEHPGIVEMIGNLSERDRYEVLRFAEFLRYQRGGPRGDAVGENGLL
jgi:hypothetical protein